MTSLTRRQFARASIAGASLLAAPRILPSRLLGAAAPSKRLRVGQIGCGRIALGHDVPNVLASGLADYVAVCDVDSLRAAGGKTFVEGFHAKQGTPCPPIDVVRDYRELMSRKDIDAIVISTPDHWHAEPALAAVQAGKHVYLQKPMTMTHAEGQLLRRAIARSGSIFQLGAQQRSSQQFRRACELVRSGRVGTLRTVEIGLPIDETTPDQPEQPVPPELDYEQWLGPTPLEYYTEQRVHSKDVPSRPGWLRNDAYCLGMITGWGAHHYDILHWALDLEDGGPTRIEGRAEFPKNRIWNVHGAYRVELDYPRGVKVVVSDAFPNGLKFIGDDGWIFVSRGSVATKDPAVPRGRLRPLDSSRPELLEQAGVTVELPRSTEHHLNWVEAVLAGRQALVPAPVSHRVNTACIVSWIAMKLGRPLRWDVANERFIDDPAANAMLTRPERGRYGALRLAASLGIA
jgi:myo-inositol 2-dehydrogenase / D-chiro-inositol 1-dehydrogenase